MKCKTVNLVYQPCYSAYMSSPFKPGYVDSIRLHFINTFSIIGLLSCLLLFAFLIWSGENDYIFLLIYVVSVIPVFLGAIYFAYKKDQVTASSFALITYVAGSLAAVTLDLTAFLAMIMIFILSAMFITVLWWQRVVAFVILFGSIATKFLLEMSLIHIDGVSNTDIPITTLVFIGVFLFSIVTYVMIISILVIRGLHDSERLKEQTEELRQTLKIKDRLFSLISHDLVGSIGNNSVILEEICGGNIEPSQQALEILRDSTKSTNNLLQELLHWAVGQERGFSPTLERFKLCDAIDQVLNLMSSTLVSKKIGAFNLCDKHAIVHADKSMIRAVLRNLISNAVKFSDPGSQIEIRCEQLISNYKISVIDQGVGMSQEAISKVFRAKVESSAGTSLEKGTGMGLLMSSDFVDAHKGDIGVVSTPGIGSTFWFTIPLSEENYAKT